MGSQVYTVDNTDVTHATFYVPGVNNVDKSFPVTPSTTNVKGTFYIHIENGFDTNVDLHLQGTHNRDENMTAPVQDANTETVERNTNGAFFGTTGHSYIRVEVTPASDPTSGEMTFTFQGREE